MAENGLDIVLLIGRPAAGKSEVIDYIKKTPIGSRIELLRIGKLEELDDFPYIWEKFEEDDIRVKMGHDRIYTDENYYFKDEWFWNFLIEKMALAHKTRLLEEPDMLQKKTLLIEFARGGENGFGEAFEHLSEEILKKATIFYIKVSYDESCRKNNRRFKPDLAHSILHHSLPQEKMDHYYKVNDWEKLTAQSPTHIEIKGIKVPYVAFENEEDYTSTKTELLGEKLQECFTKLYGIYSNK